jgi:hypothetical protein
MNYVITGFRHSENVRVFAFDGVATDHSRIHFTVDVDLDIVRKYRVPLQDLPRLCCGMLKSQEDGAPHAGSLTLSEDYIRQYADSCAAARERSISNRKPSHRRPSAKTGQAWRGAQH